MEPTSSDKIKRTITELKNNFSWFWDFDIAVYLIIAGIIILITPLLLSVYLFTNHYYIRAVIILLLWITVIIKCILDYRQKIFSYLSAVIIVVWFVFTLLIGLVFS